MSWTLLFSTTLTLILVIDPFGNLAGFHAILSTCPPEKRRPTLIRELLIALTALLLFLFTGPYIMRALHLQTPSLGISGAILLFIIALGMVFPAKSTLSTEDAQDPFIVPLAIPLIAGPSTFILLLLYSQRYSEQMLTITTATILAWLFSACVLLLATYVMRYLGRKGTRALERLMGMVLIILSVQMFLDGLDLWHNSQSPAGVDEVKTMANG